MEVPGPGVEFKPELQPTPLCQAGDQTNDSTETAGSLALCATAKMTTDQKQPGKPSTSDFPNIE